MESFVVVYDEQTYSVQLPNHVQLHQIAPALAQKLDLPQNETDGTVYVYYLGIGDERPLDPQQTFDDLGLPPETTLTLWQQTIDRPASEPPSFDEVFVRPLRPSTRQQNRNRWIGIASFLSLILVSGLVYSGLFMVTRTVESSPIDSNLPLPTATPTPWAIFNDTNPDDDGLLRLPWQVEDAVYSTYLGQVIFLTNQPRALHVYDLQTQNTQQISLWQEWADPSLPHMLDISPDGERLVITHETGRTLLHLDTLLGQKVSLHDDDDPLCIVVVDEDEYCFLPTTNELPSTADVQDIVILPKQSMTLTLAQHQYAFYDMQTGKVYQYPLTGITIDETYRIGNGRFLFVNPAQTEVTIVTRLELANGDVIDYLFKRPFPQPTPEE